MRLIDLTYYFCCSSCGLAMLLFYGCNESSQLPDDGVSTVRIASWGGAFQDDLIAHWVKPAADAVRISIDPESWDGDYAALATRIRRGICQWDLIHVEGFFVDNPEARELFVSFPGRSLKALDPQLSRPDAVPVLEYGYVLAYRTDLVAFSREPDWSDYFNADLIKAKRGARDFPIGNIEIALLSMQKDLVKDLYGPHLSRGQVEQAVEDALRQFDRIKPYIVWWKSGDELQRDLTTGATPLSAAWSGRLLSAYQMLKRSDQRDPPLRFVESTSLVSTDWWVVPKGARNAEKANSLLVSMYETQEGTDGAQAFSSAQGYAVPNNAQSQPSGTEAAILRLGLSANPHTRGRLQESFWGKHYTWVSAKWNAWRAR